MIKNTLISVIPHEQQEYETCGNYKYVKELNTNIFTISDTGNDDYNFLIKIHEIIEEHLTRRVGIEEKDILEFDLLFEKEREEGLHSDTDECGDDDRAIYKKQHQFATKIEQMLCDEMNLFWGDYEKIIYEM